VCRGHEPSSAHREVQRPLADWWEGRYGNTDPQRCKTATCRCLGLQHRPAQPSVDPALCAAMCVSASRCGPHVESTAASSTGCRRGAATISRRRPAQQAPAGCGVGHVAAASSSAVSRPVGWRPEGGVQAEAIERGAVHRGGIKRGGCPASSLDRHGTRERAFHPQTTIHRRAQTMPAGRSFTDRQVGARSCSRLHWLLFRERACVPAMVQRYGRSLLLMVDSICRNAVLA
jgi:hypothetical protein